MYLAVVSQGKNMFPFEENGTPGKQCGEAMTHCVALGKFLVGDRPKRAVRGFGSKFVLRACLIYIGPKVGQSRANQNRCAWFAWDCLQRL